MPPIFDFRCPECGHEVEHIVKDPGAQATCWHCWEGRNKDVKMTKLIGATKTDFTEADSSPIKRGRS